MVRIFLGLLIIWRAKEVLIVFLGHCIRTKTMLALITLGDIGAYFYSSCLPGRLILFIILAFDGLVIDIFPIHI